MALPAQDSSKVLMHEDMNSVPAATAAPAGFFATLTGFTKTLAILLIASYVTFMFIPERIIEYVALIPGRTLPMIWNLATYSLVELDAGRLVFDIVAVAICLRELEPIWGVSEVIRFSLVVSSATGIALFLLMIVMFAGTQRPRYLYDAIGGFTPVAAGLFVGVKQNIPDEHVGAALRMKHLPPLAVVVAIVYGVIMQDMYAIVLVTLGTWFGWIYLRYFQPKEDGLIGDEGEDFAFETFFPGPLRPGVAVVAGLAESICCGWLKAWKGQSAQKPVSDMENVTLDTSQEATRRRERGARALEQRLLAVQKNRALSSDAPQEKSSPGSLSSSRSAQPTAHKPEAES